MKKTLTLAVISASFAALAGVPIKWSVETSRADERVIEVYHGESLDMEVTFKSYGKILQLPTNEVAATFWQTNGMNTAYWRTNNVEIVASNGIMRTTFGPEQDVGAKTLRGFIGIPGQIYRAAFVLRFKDAPGYDVSVVEWPYRLLDFKTIEVVNPPYYTKKETGEVITNSVTRNLITDAIGIDYIALPFDPERNYDEGDVVLINNAFYCFKRQWLSAWGEDPISGNYVDPLENFSDLGAALFAKEFLPLGWGGTNTTSYKMVNAGFGNNRWTYFTLDPNGIGFRDQNGGEFRMVNDELRYQEGAYSWSKRIRNLLTTDGVLPFTSTSLNETYKSSPTSPYYVYTYLTNNYLTAIRVSEDYLKKSDAGATYLTKADAASTYTAASNLSASILAEIANTKIQYIYNSTGNIRLRYDGWLERETHNGWNVSFTNTNDGSVMRWSNPDRWIMNHANFGTLNFVRENGVIYCTENPSMRFAEEYTGQTVISLRILGTYYAFPDPSGSFTWVNYDQYAKLSEIDFSTNNTTLVETIDAQKPTANEIGAYSSASGAALESDVAQMNAQLNTIGATLNAEDAKFEVTNYNSAVHMPEASFSVKVLNEQTGSNEWFLAWKEMTRWDWFLGAFGSYTNWLDGVISQKSEREYAFYDGVTGNPAPDGFFWVGQPRVAICAGMAYQRYVQSDGEVWILESNGMVSELNGTSNGFFRVTDSENEVQFEIIKGDKRTLAAAPRTMTSEVMGVTHYFTEYATTNAVSNPVARFKRNLTDSEWIYESSESCPCNVSWTDKGGGVYEVEWWPIATEPKMFMSAVYETGGSTRIVQHAPVEMQKIIIGGVEYTIGTATIDGKTVLTLTEAQ